MDVFKLMIKDFVPNAEMGIMKLIIYVIYVTPVAPLVLIPLIVWLVPMDIIGQLMMGDYAHLVQMDVLLANCQAFAIHVCSLTISMAIIA